MQWLKNIKDYSEWGIASEGRYGINTKRRRFFASEEASPSLQPPTIHYENTWMEPTDRTLSLTTPPTTKQYARIYIEGEEGATIYWRTTDTELWSVWEYEYYDISVMAAEDIVVEAYQVTDGGESEVGVLELIHLWSASVDWGVASTGANEAKLNVESADPDSPVTKLYYFDQINPLNPVWTLHENVPDIPVEYGTYWVMYVREVEGYLADWDWVLCQWCPCPTLSITDDYGLMCDPAEFPDFDYTNFTAVIRDDPSHYAYAFYQDEEDPTYPNYRTFPLLNEMRDTALCDVTAIPPLGYLTTAQVAVVTRDTSK